MTFWGRHERLGLMPYFLPWAMIAAMEPELVLRLGETSACEGTEALVGAVASQHRRLVRLAETMDDAGWRASTRCPRWDAHGVLAHLVWANVAARSLLAEVPMPFRASSIDPRVFPNNYVEAHADQPVAETAADLSTSTEELLDELERDHAGQRFPFFYGWPVEWRIVAAHAHWDAWLHERDILLPAARLPESDDVESRYALAYGLLVAGYSGGTTGAELNEELVVGGVGGGRYRIRVAPGEVTIRVRPPDAGDAIHGPDAAALADALSGRGPDVASVCRRRDDTTEALSTLRAFFLTPI